MKLLLFLCSAVASQGFSTWVRPVQRTSVHLEVARTSSLETKRAPPRTGILQSVLDIILDSPLWKHVLVPQARKKIVDTAVENGIPWKDSRAWLEDQNGPWTGSPVLHNDDIIPDFYRQSFHAYERGNLCWDAAIEAEIASAAVGARNFPAAGRLGEQVFRESFQAAFTEGGASCPLNGKIVDLGCGTGLSTRMLARNYPQASEILGIDLSPYFCKVAQFLLDAEPMGMEEGGPWVNTIRKDDRIRYQVGNAAATGLPDNSVDVVNLQFVAHELPHAVTLEVLRESHRILSAEGGQLWFCEMDFETPGYAAQRRNALLFSLIRSTEPYLDDYADHHQEVRDCLRRLFARTIITPATGRHFAIVATKDSNCANHVLDDMRFDIDGQYRIKDTHLKMFENKL